MHRTLKSLVVAALLGVSLSGCSDFLSGPTVDEDPNNPTVENTSEDNLFAGFQASQFTNYSSTLAFTICGYVQQCKGVNGRFVETQLTEYNTSPLTFDINFTGVYALGGLRDLREVQAKLDARNVQDPLYEGITHVWEALIMSEAADKWGDIPYSEAASDAIPTPVLDDQLAVYNALVALLDQAIVELADPTGVGPGGVDFVYGGNAAAWTAMAHTLKARILLHTLRHPSVCGPTITAACPVLPTIVAETNLGLPVSGAQDFTTVVSGATAQEQNGWFQFYSASGFDDDLRAGDFIVSLMSTRNAGGEDPRFDSYFVQPEDPSVGRPADGAGPFIARQMTPGPGNPAFPQPWVTGDENALIRAEANFYLGGAGLAQPDLDAVRVTKYGLNAVAATLPAIMEEKYVSLFQSPEIWNDWKRTGCPALVSTSTQGLGPVGGEIPRRVYYGQTEFDVNRNVPDASTQVGAGAPNQPGFRNDNDPAPNPVCA
jgi:hypothetical protein